MNISPAFVRTHQTRRTLLKKTITNTTNSQTQFSNVVFKSGSYVLSCCGKNVIQSSFRTELNKLIIANTLQSFKPLYHSHFPVFTLLFCFLLKMDLLNGLTFADSHIQCSVRNFQFISNKAAAMSLLRPPPSQIRTKQPVKLNK